MDNLKTNIQDLASFYLPEVINIRRDIHKNPELSGEEYQTMEYISNRLNAIGVKHTKGIAKTGIIADIKGEKPGNKNICLRAEIDALEIEETNTFNYKSKNKGKMHACGHDAHTASLIGVAAILNKLKSSFGGTIRLIFQPAEEQLPGGAKFMIEEGAIIGQQLIIGQHVLPDLDSGKIGMKKGAYMASTDEMYLKVSGTGGHAATPKHTTDVVLVAAIIRKELHDHFTKENIDNNAILAFGKFIADGQTNVIPSEVNLEGTFRTFNEEFRNRMHIELSNIANNIGKKYNCKAELTIKHGYPSVYNDEDLTQKVWDSSVEFMGKDNVVELNAQLLAEDFAWYGQHIPACFYRLGVKEVGQNNIKNLHTPNFDIDEKALGNSVGLMSWIALKMISD